MRKMLNKKGFTLAELLIVVAIIAVLVAIAIPVFTTQLEKSREATDISNLRAAYAEVMAAYLADGATGTPSATVTARQTIADWQNAANSKLVVRVDGTEYELPVSAKINGATWTVTIDPNTSELIKIS